MSYQTMSGLERERVKVGIPAKEQFQVFIKPQCFCDAYLKEDSCENIAYIPNICSDDNTIFLKHRTQYSIGIINSSNFDADAEIFIDGVLVGVFRIHKNSNSFQLERPIDTNSAFTFVSKNSEEALVSGLNINENSRLGEVCVYIRPEDRSYKNSPVYRAISSGNINDKPDAICNGDSLVRPGDVPAAACANARHARGVPVETDFSPPNSSSLISHRHTVPAYKSKSTGATLLGPCTTQSFIKSSPLPTKGMHAFTFILRLGDPNSNTLFYINNMERYKPCIYNNN